MKVIANEHRTESGKEFNLYLALVHYPVVNKEGQTIASAVTNLDLHDISRVGKTYGVKSFYVITPLVDQKALVQKIISHWTNGSGAVYNPARRSALKLIKIKDNWVIMNKMFHHQ